MVLDKRPQSALDINNSQGNPEAGCIYAVITGKRPVSRRNRASWYLSQLNKVIKCDPADSLVEPGPEETTDISDDYPQETPISEPQDIRLVSVTCSQDDAKQFQARTDQQKFLVTPNTRVSFLSRSVATSIVLDLSPSVVSVNSENGCVFLDSMFDALKRTLHLLVKSHEIPSDLQDKPRVLEPQVFISVIAYTPFLIAKNNQVIVQNRRVSSLNIGQVLVEIWLSLNRLTQEIHELVSTTCGVSLDFDANRTASTNNVFRFPHSSSGSIMRHPGSVLDDIYELGLFAASLMPRLSRLSIIVISDGLFASTNDLNTFRIKSIAVSFVSLAPAATHPDSCFGYTPYTDLMRFVAKTTLGVYLVHQDLIHLSQKLSKDKTISLLQNPLHKLFCWSLHSEDDDQLCSTPLASNHPQFDLNFDPTDTGELRGVARFFTLDQHMTTAPRLSANDNREIPNRQQYLDWRLFKQLDRNLDADFEQVLACLLREGYLIKYIQFKRNEQTRIVARLVLHWRFNLDLEQELIAPYWSSTDPFELGESNQLMMRPLNAPLYGDTYCEIFVHGSYSFLHNLYCNRKVKRRSEFRDIAYRQFRQLIDCVCQTHERLQYLSRFYRDSSLSKIPSYLMHGNSLLYEQPHTHRLTSTIENVMDETKINEFQEYWQKISYLDTRSWKNLMHVHTLRLILEHDQPKHKNIQHQNANGRYTHVQCRRSLSSVSNFIKNYASFALLEDSTYIKFIYNRDDDLREIETSATKGFIVIKINKLLPIVVVHLMFTSGILDSHRVQIVSYLEQELISCKLRNTKTSVTQMDNILKCKTISPSSDSCCVSIKSPLERMLKVYSRNFIVDFLVNNWAHGLPGSCPYNDQQSIKKTKSSATANPQPIDTSHNVSIGGVTRSARGEQSIKEGTRDAHSPENNIDKYNLVFGKYLYGIRVINTMSNLPHDILPILTANVLSKISAILVNMRIKQGFHIAFNSSGILNLVVELAMTDPSNQDHTSGCLCQYIMFPPTIVNTNPSDIGVLGNTSSGPISVATAAAAAATPTADGAGLQSSKPSSLNGSLTNSDGFMKNSSSVQDSSPRARMDNGEVKIIREYWIEQQYGLSASSEAYHGSLKNKRYSEVVDHLFLTDSAIFESLLTYDILQLLCDKLSPAHDLDLYLNKASASTTVNTSLFSPTISTNSCEIFENGSTSFDQNLPSNLVEGSNKDGSPKTPLLESSYKFSLVKFLDYCQLASLNVLLFREASEFFNPSSVATGEHKKPADQPYSRLEATRTDLAPSHPNFGKSQLSRKMSADASDYDADHQMTLTATSKREHRCSYQNDNFSSNSVAAYSYSQSNTIYSASLNHLFLETLHRRFKQMHDKELALSEYDLRKLPPYLKLRKLTCEDSDESSSTPVFYTSKSSLIGANRLSHAEDHDEDSSISSADNNFRNSHDEASEGRDSDGANQGIEWRCYLRKANQENLMIILIPATLDDVVKWLNLVCSGGLDSKDSSFNGHDPVCPVFVFRCSSTMMNEHILSFLGDTSGSQTPDKSDPESDLNLHFGQPCKYMNRLLTINDELNNDILSIARYGTTLSQATDEKALEVVHFRAFLRKIKNTVLKSRFSSLNDAYLSELFVNKDDISYYINNVDLDTQKKYHVSSHLRNLAEFIKSYEEYTDLLPKEPGKPCNKLLNSILLQKCGLFINQPIARYDESNPLMKHLHDKKLLFLMRLNYKVELPLLEETLAKSSSLKSFVSMKHTSAHSQQPPPLPQQQQQYNNLVFSSSAVATSSTNLLGSPGEISRLSVFQQQHQSMISSSLGRSSDGPRLMEMKYGSVGASAGHAIMSPASSGFVSHTQERTAPVLKVSQNSARFGGSNSGISSMSTSLNDSIILEAFRSTKTCSIRDIPDANILSPTSTDDHTDPICLRHEAHLAEVLRQSRERKESNHYRRVLKSKGTYNQSHSAIDQALKKVDSLGRLEHFCLTPLLFSTSWRSKLAPVRDHTIEAGGRSRSSADSNSGLHYRGFNQSRDSGETIKATSESSSTHTEVLSSKIATEAVDKTVFQQLTSSCAADQQQQDDDADERWHQMVCTNYIKEYEQYIQTLGFNSVQIRHQSNLKTSASTSSTSIPPPDPSSSTPGKSSLKRAYRYPSSTTNLSHLKVAATSVTVPTDASPNSKAARKGSIPVTSVSSSSAFSTSNIAGTTTYNTGYLIKFLNGGCLVFKVGFCKPYVYSILYSIEGERFNNSSTKMNMAAFLDELDNIKVTLHLHSFTYDYHLRGIYSYISGRQLTFNPGYHLISFLDDFRKYYQKAPNYARNHILSGEICIPNIKVTGQQLYNYIVTHNSAYNMDVLEMSSSFAGIISSLSNRALSTDDSRSESGSQRDLASSFNGAESYPPLRSHANDYVLVELKREKVRYRDGKDPDIFDCALLITHDFQQYHNQSPQSAKTAGNTLTLKYFLLLTNQRDLYPKLIHTYDSIISLGCHRPIRLGLAAQLNKTTEQTNNRTFLDNPTPIITVAPGSNHSDPDDLQSSELQSSGEVSGPQSIISTANSVQSSGSGLQFGPLNILDGKASTDHYQGSIQAIAVATNVSDSTEVALEAFGAKDSVDGASISRLKTTINQQDSSAPTLSKLSAQEAAKVSEQLLASSVEDYSCMGDSSPTYRRRRIDSTNSSKQNVNPPATQERTICDEEITYLGYFSSDEMDMLRFLQEKTNNLRKHIEQVVRQAEVHYQRDFLWHKLMQRTTATANNKSDEIPLSVDELVQLLTIVEAIDLAALDGQLATFSAMHINWQMKLLKAFNDLKLSPSNQHRIYTVKASKMLVLYIDPNCTTAFILVTVDTEKGQVEQNLLMKDKHECTKVSEKVSTRSGDSGHCSTQQKTVPFELEQECHQLINDFVNFCAAFMWSTFLA